MISRRRRVAVVGGGVAGLGAAWALRQNADVTLYDRAPRFGGHAWTVDIDYDGAPMPVDIGFICFNRPNYPNFTNLLQHLDVKTVWTDMSFSVSDPKGYEWSSDPWGVFAWKRNMLDAKFRGLLNEILIFNNIARRELIAGDIPEQTLGDWLDAHGFSEIFRIAYLLPMSAAIWSTPEKLMLDYPVGSFLTFFDNHRLMHTLRPIWRTVAGGSRAYVGKMLHDLSPSLRPAAHIETIRPAGPGRIQIVERGKPSQAFDAVILSCHADQSKRMLDGCYKDQRLALGSVRFSSNTAYLHRDASLMPERRAAWASWNVLKGEDNKVCITYWMNRLQKLPNDKPVFVTLNPTRPPAKDKTFGVYEFDHPMYDAPSAAARRSVQRIQGRDGLFFAGSWLGDGFHEAGLRTGLEAAFALGGSVPWEATTQHTHTLSHSLFSQAPHSIAPLSMAAGG
ncbi:MAG: FAD-dependent oxidoreductase [Hyphomonadaceae bacterium]|nr:FAD-dependent oxidoreductase [Hyphomonadaceae bacterium]